MRENSETFRKATTWRTAILNGCSLLAASSFKKSLFSEWLLEWSQFRFRALFPATVSLFSSRKVHLKEGLIRKLAHLTLTWGLSLRGCPFRTEALWYPNTSLCFQNHCTHFPGSEGKLNRNLSCWHKEDREGTYLSPKSPHSLSIS